jgi:hypothetical protein
MSLTSVRLYPFVTLQINCIRVLWFNGHSDTWYSDYLGPESVVGPSMSTETVHWLDNIDSPRQSTIDRRRRLCVNTALVQKGLCYQSTRSYEFQDKTS